MALTSEAGHAGPGLSRGPPPLFVCFGAFGAGKTTLASLVAPRLPECLVLDVDWLLPSLQVLTGRDLREEPASWLALGNIWLAVAAASSRAGRSTVLFTPATPAEVEALGYRPLIGDIYGLLLDWGDEELTRRLAKRPRWPAASTSEALLDASKYRTFGHPSIRTDLASQEECAARIVAWARSLISV